MNNRRKLYILVPVILAVTFLAGIFCQQLLHSHISETEKEKKFGNVLNMIRDQYVDKVDIDSLLEATIPGLLTNLDPHSVYIPAEELQAYNDELEGSFSGVGIQFSVVSDTICVNEVIPDGPSEKVGIMAGDQIIKIDGKEVAGKGISNDDIMKMLKGKKGTAVEVTVKRRYTSKPLQFKITRDDIPVKSVDSYYMASPTIGYVRINKFGRTTYKEFVEALNKLKAKGAKDYIIDLRDNGGGYMEMAVLMINEFFGPGKEIVYTKGRNTGEDENILSDGTGKFSKNRVVVLLDEFSASASEIFAGAIQDNDRGLIIGRRSFGKGLVQRQIDLPDGSAIRLTIARYYTPSGRCIQKDYSDAVSYETDIIDRYNRGEAFIEDSIHLENLPKFKTSTGRIVYGGGGIMPDIFVPNDTTGYTPYFTRVSNAQIIQPYVRNYVERNYSTLSKAKNLNQLNSVLPSDSEIINDFVEYAYTNAGINRQWAYINKSADLIVNQIKALIARDVLGFAAFIEELNKGDKTVQTAIQELNNGNANFPIKAKK